MAFHSLLSAYNMLELTNITKTFGGVRAVDSVSFSIDEGSLTAIIGPNGAGKTTLFNLIAAAMPPSDGHISFMGKRLPPQPHKAAKRGIARTFQNVRLFHEMTLLENVLCAWNTGSFVGCSIWPGVYREAERLRMKRASYILEDMGLKDDMYARAGDLPFGKQRLAEIARALALSPKMLLLDEPAAGLNRTESAQLSKLIRHIVSSGVTVLLVEHDMQLVMRLAERVIVLDSGKLIADGAPSDVRANQRVVEAYLGIAEC